MSKNRKVLFNIILFEPQTKYKIVSQAAVWAITPTYVFYKINYAFTMLVVSVVGFFATLYDMAFGGEEQ